MKKIFFAGLVCIGLLASFAYIKDEKSDPKQVAYNFTIAMNNFNFEEAKKYGTEETGKMLDMLSSFASLAPDSVKEQAKSYKVEIKDVIEKGDKCTVMLTNGGEKAEKIELMKVKDIWKVHMSKEEMAEAPEAEKSED